jgi:hypothetical protein
LVKAKEIKGEEGKKEGRKERKKKKKEKPYCSCPSGFGFPLPSPYC